jgi:hypothetical protein
MKIQYVSRYIELSEEGLVVKMVCPSDQGLLLSNLDNEDNIYLYCLECNYKRIVGLKAYSEIVEAVNKNDRL